MRTEQEIALWNEFKCKNIPECIRANYFDSVLNGEDAVVILKEMINGVLKDFELTPLKVDAVLGEIDPDVDQHGKIHSLTLQALFDITRLIDGSTLNARFTMERIRQYAEVVEREPKKQELLLKWLNRALGFLVTGG